MASLGAVFLKNIIKQQKNWKRNGKVELIREDNLDFKIFI